MRRLSFTLLLGVIVAIGGLLAITIAPWFDLEQELGLPLLFKARGPVAAPRDVVIVAIDEESANQLGVSQKPREWPRTLHAELVRALTRAGARVIVFDLTFDTSSPDPAEDRAFAAALREAGNVLVTESAHKEVVQIGGGRGGPAGTAVIDRRVPPIAVIEEAVAGHAPFLVPKSSRVDAYLTFWSGAPDQPTLPLLALQVYAASAAPGDPGQAAGSAGRQRLTQTLRAMQAGGMTSFLNLYGPPRTVTSVPYAQVLAQARAQSGSPDQGSMWAGRFAGKAVFVGLSARTPAGQDRLRDDYRTVFSQADGLNLTGVELAATAFANLLEDRPVRPAEVQWHIAVALLWAVILAAVFHRLPPVRALAVAATLSVAHLWLVVDRFATAAWWLPAAVPVGVQVPLALFAAIAIGYRVTQREREAVKKAFGYFLPTEMVDRIVADLGAMTRSNRVVFGSCLATDAGNYTTLAERIDPGRLAELMNDYFARLFVPVEQSGGAVVDVVGDAMVAVWAASGSNQGLRRDACGAALEIVARVDQFNAALSEGPDGLVLPTRLGMHSGDMLVGNIGASHHFEFRAVGDIVNTASRLQGLNKVLGTTLLASAETVEGLADLVARPMGTFLLVGKTTPLGVVELLGRHDVADPARDRLCETFGRALAHHAARRWAEAAELFAEILQDRPDDGPSRFYLARCQTLLAHPPDAAWSPTITVDSK